MEQLGIGAVERRTKLESLSKEEVIASHIIVEAELARVVRELYRIRNQNVTDEQIGLIMQEQLDELKNKVFGQSSERYKKPAKDGDGNDANKPAKPRVKKPSERYPNIPVRDEFVTINPPPPCPCCGKIMTDSGMTEFSERLTVIPKRYEIVRQHLAKFRCSCQGAIVTADAPPRIIKGGTYSDEMIQDVALSKYCDLIPIERYVAMAERAGLADLPPNSLIETTHAFADFVSGAYSLLKDGIMRARVLSADETPHRMLEGDEKKSWSLWGFSTPKLCYLECHDTRSADVASPILMSSSCEILVSDVYSGYGKATRVANEARRAAGKPLITNAHCNAHARRYFFKAWPKYPEAAFYLDHYHEIYRLNSKAKGQPPPVVLELRAQMLPRFEAMKKKALEELAGYPRAGKYGKALHYFLDNYKSFTLFLGDAEVPVDNNGQERLLRDHVVGRKTWYGTHSKRGALTAAILFSLVETCKLNQVNPREYFKHLVEDLLAGSKPYTPAHFNLPS